MERDRVPVIAIRPSQNPVFHEDAPEIGRVPERVQQGTRFAEDVAEIALANRVVGKLQTRKWEDKDGQERYTTEIVANEMKMLGGRNDGRKDSAAGSDRNNGRSQQPKSRARPSKPAAPATADLNDDIPF